MITLLFCPARKIIFVAYMNHVQFSYQMLFKIQVISTLAAGFQENGDGDSPPSIEAVRFSPQ